MAQDELGRQLGGHPATERDHPKRDEPVHDGYADHWAPRLPLGITKIDRCIKKRGGGLYTIGPVLTNNLMKYMAKGKEDG